MAGLKSSASSTEMFVRAMSRARRSCVVPKWFNDSLNSDETTKRDSGDEVGMADYALFLARFGL
ncbi:MAG: hypothetical protein U1E64_14525 [Sphingomonadaceae bacterium]